MHLISMFCDFCLRLGTCACIFLPFSSMSSFNNEIAMQFSFPLIFYSVYMRSVPFQFFLYDLKFPFSFFLCHVC
uniref:Uncharacterized protein n=1 Tax=Setaria italica TaxID=4555 RepID=K3Y3Z7_SETIT